MTVSSVIFIVIFSEDSVKSHFFSRLFAIRSRLGPLGRPPAEGALLISIDTFPLGRGSPGNLLERNGIYWEAIGEGVGERAFGIVLRRDEPTEIQPQASEPMIDASGGIHMEFRHEHMTSSVGKPSETFPSFQRI
jgi:hypothetical protein